MSPQANRTLHSQANAETRYFVKKKTLLALSKLTVLSSDLPEDQLDKQVDGKKKEEESSARFVVSRLINRVGM